MVQIYYFYQWDRTLDQFSSFWYPNIYFVCFNWTKPKFSILQLNSVYDGISRTTLTRSGQQFRKDQDIKTSDLQKTKSKEDNSENVDNFNLKLLEQNQFKLLEVSNYHIITVKKATKLTSTPKHEDVLAKLLLLGWRKSGSITNSGFPDEKEGLSKIKVLKEEKSEENEESCLSFVFGFYYYVC